jgi:hypothetical protein
VLAEHIYFGACRDGRLPDQLAAYVRRTAAELEAVSSRRLLGGDLVFSRSIEFGT